MVLNFEARAANLVMTKQNKNLIKLRRSVVRWILGFTSPKVATASRSEGIFILRLNR
ncbi:hypothetical protein UNSW1_282 [Campylobacter concisus UNSW1]|nr:hypothetical protein UNSW1_282 [Campylobacter concisus UNSW1]